MAYIQFQLRRGTAAEWSSANPVLAVAEMGVETDTKKFKIGDGTTVWNSLAYGGLSGMSGFSGASGFSGYSGSAGGASLTNDTTTNSDAYYPAMSYNSTSGTWTSAYVSSTKLYFNPSTGSLNATNFNSLSDANAKENVAKINNGLDVVKALEGVSFNWKESGSKSFGVIAQELEKIIPEAVETNSHGTKSVNYAMITAFLIEAIKELSQRIDNK